MMRSVAACARIFRGLACEPATASNTALSRHITSSTSGLAMSKESVTGANIYIKGEDPKIQPDDQYPDWLWSLAEPGKSMKQLSMEANTLGYNDMPDEDFFRFVKLQRKAKIKQNNLNRAKKR